MNRRGNNRGGDSGKKWSRKRKAEEAAAKLGSQRANGSGGYDVVHGSNAKFEAYYSLVGLHNTRYDGEKKKFVACVDDEEKHKERELFMASMRAILPVSFRVDRGLDPTIQKKLLEELQQFVGKEMEVEIELPRKSAAFGGMKNIMEKGTNASDTAGEHEEGGAKDDTNQNLANDRFVIKRKIAPAKPIPFISSNSRTLGYQLSVDRRTLKRNKSLEPLHTWLKIQTDCGHITRQVRSRAVLSFILFLLNICLPPGNREHDPSCGSRFQARNECAGYVCRPWKQDLSAFGNCGGLEYEAL